jgi:molybdopterin-guanine dinucleotide biosynthesis protein A
LPARISASSLLDVQLLLDQNQLAVWRLMEKLRPEVVMITEERAKQLRNVNTVEDWRELGFGDP